MHLIQDSIEVLPSVLVIFLTVCFFATVDFLLKKVSQSPNSFIYHLLFAPIFAEGKKKCMEINGNHNLIAKPNIEDMSYSTPNANGNGHVAVNTKSQGLKIWKIQNILMSEIHSVVSGPFAFICVYLEPAMLDDIVGKFTPLALGLICFSLGYFVHDTIHMLRKRVTTETIELLLHHFIIFITYGLAVWQRTYIAFAVVSLFMEVNSVFLHARQLANLRNVNRSAPLYKLLCAVNVGTLVTFRGLTTAWMVRWIWQNYARLPLPIAALGASGLVVISVMNSVLLARLVKADYFSGSKARKNS